MTASATIDIATYTNPTAGTTSSTKTYAVNNSVDFANALDSANKNYSADDTTSTIVNSNPHGKIFKTQNNDKKSNNVKDTSSDNVKTKTTTADTDAKSKPEDKVSQNDNNKTTKQAGDAVQENTTNKDIKKPQEQEKNSDSDSESESDSQSDSNNPQNNQQSSQQNQQENQQPTQQENQQPVAQDNQQAVVQVVQPQAPQTNQPPTQQVNQQIVPQNNQPPATADNQQAAATNKTDSKPADDTSNANNATLPIENIIVSLSTAVQAQAASTTVNTTPPTDVPNNQTAVETISAQTAQEDLNVDLTNLGDNLANKIANATNKASTIQVQPQTQQALSNLKISPQAPQQAKIQTQGQPQAQLQPQTAQSTDTTTSQTPVTQTPIIEVNTNIIDADANVVKSLPNENSKQDIQNIQNKTILTQEILDKTNAKITNVETSNTSDSNSDSNNLLNSQNAQEQVVKLTIENNSANNKAQDVAQNASLDIAQNAQNTQNIQNATLSVHDTTTQTAFTQTLNNAQAQQSKDLSKTDILSQINNQLNTKQLQTGETTKINIILQPENLGKITLELINSKEGLTAKMTTDNEQVKELLSKHLDNLKDTMSNQGVNVGNITVKVEETQKQSNNPSSFENWQAKQGNQEFSNNAQNQGKKGSSSDEQIGNATAADSDVDTDISVESGPITERNIENTVSISAGSGRVDYKV